MYSIGGNVMQCKERLEAYLREHQVPYMHQHHAQAFTAQKIAESEHIPGKMVTKTVIVLADNNMIALVLPASYRADLNKMVLTRKSGGCKLERVDSSQKGKGSCKRS